MTPDYACVEAPLESALVDELLMLNERAGFTAAGMRCDKSVPRVIYRKSFGWMNSQKPEQRSLHR